MTPRSPARIAIEEEIYWKMMCILPRIKRKGKEKETREGGKVVTPTAR
jgi:hypothetical protein